MENVELIIRIINTISLCKTAITEVTQMYTLNHKYIIIINNLVIKSCFFLILV